MLVIITDYNPKGVAMVLPVSTRAVVLRPPVLKIINFNCYF